MFVKKALLAGIALATPLAASALNTLYIDNVQQPGSVTSINVTNTEVRITTNSGGATPTPTATATASPAPSPSPTPVPEGNCVTPPGVEVAGTIDLNNPGGQIRVALARETKAYKVLTTSNSSLYGQFTFANTAGTENIARIAWISACPGTPGYSDTVATTPRCAASGSEITSIGWAQYAKRGECQLAPNSVYYLNVRNASTLDPTGSTCPSGTSCDVWRNIYTWQ
jgi:hypothetical protein